VSFYVDEYTVPANTAKANAVKRKIGVSAGVVRVIIPDFPPETARLAGMALEHKGHRFFPSEADSWFAAAFFNYPISIHYEIEESPYEVEWLVYNEDDTFPHTLRITIGVFPFEAEDPQIPLLKDLILVTTHLKELLSKAFGLEESETDG